MKDFFRYLFKPSFWIGNYPVNKQWDKKLNELMDSGKNIKITGGSIIEIDGISMWVDNYPYAYGKLCNLSDDFLPKRRTRERLLEFTLNHLFKVKS